MGEVELQRMMDELEHEVRMEGAGEASRRYAWQLERDVSCAGFYGNGDAVGEEIMRRLREARSFWRILLGGTA